MGETFQDPSSDSQPFTTRASDLGYRKQGEVGLEIQREKSASRIQFLQLDGQVRLTKHSREQWGARVRYGLVRPQQSFTFADATHSLGSTETKGA